MAKREFLMLAHKYDEKKHSINGWWASEKLDGIRAFWDGGISKGILAEEVPWANVEKDSRYRERVVSTGLWSRYGNVIRAPDWWTNRLPDIPLDGELWSPVGWQGLSSKVKSHYGDWDGVGYYVFDSPSLGAVFANGVINTINYKKELSGIDRWISEHGGMIKQGKYFAHTYEWLKSLNLELDINIHEQVRIKNRDELEEVISDVLRKGGEGVVLRDPWSVWTPERSHQLLKIKGIEDDEAIVTGYTEGKGKLEGMMGALVTNYKGNRLELSGFTEEERRTAKELFPVGSVVTFQYWRKSDNGVPKEARYLRVRARS